MTTNLISQIETCTSILAQLPPILALKSESDFGSTKPRTEKLVADAITKLPKICSLIKMRSEIEKILDNLETSAKGGETILLGSVETTFDTARFLLVQSYLTTHWAICDVVSGVAGSIFAPETQQKDLTLPPTIMNFFISKGGKGKMPNIISGFQKDYGWPSAILYELRNHFVHDGAIGKSSFFTGNSVGDGFAVTDSEWDEIEKSLKDKFETGDRKTSCEWPTSPADDLRVVLKVAMAEMDSLLGEILLLGCTSLSGYIRILSGSPV